jgi:predicted Rossmann-fold nucleotide-binding protein
LNTETVSTRIYPGGMLNTLSHSEVERLQQASQGDLAILLRRCALAVLNSGNQSDDIAALMDRYQDFSIHVQQVNRGLQLEIRNAPASAFVDGEIIAGIGELLSAVIRDLVYFDSEIKRSGHAALHHSTGITNAVFEILRNADVLQPESDPALVVCWGGHSISRQEYDYTKECGYQLGLRRLNICTGCGQGAMKGPMKGATIAHAKQRLAPGRYLGISEPGIIAAEPPNPIVNQLVIMPDIEKRLEAFVRLGHGIVIFPGGVGTLEEILYLLGILLRPDNARLPYPLVFTGPAGSADYFWQIDAFLRLILGKQVAERYQIVIDDPAKVARIMAEGMQQVRQYRETSQDAFYFNWQLKMDESFQAPFVPTHENMLNLRLYRDMPAFELAANLRKVFSGIVAGNVKPAGLAAVQKHGLFEIRGERALMEALDVILESFVNQQRMKIPGGRSYEPCYRIVNA